MLMFHYGVSGDDDDEDDDAEWWEIQKAKIKLISILIWN